ncbi:hypothetical protein [Halosimplex halophilum]|uniref:hypothetical protein n=1 Tax=Halosimplex halophilum TaxID=2559572 RepID=UPI00107F49E4|nr:hypothetical protein [Halosimplex halophilum]
MSGNERPRGILSPADRAYLRGETTFGSDQSERNARARIRERVLAGLRDFDLLADALAERDRELVFGKHVGDDPEAVRSLIAALAVLYRGAEEAGLEFGTLLEEGVSRAEADRSVAAGVDFEVRREPLDPDRLTRKLRRTGSLTLSELAYLRETDDVSLDRLLDRYATDVETDESDDWVQAKMTSF